MSHKSDARKPGEGESPPPELARAPRGRMPPLALARYLAATHRPANTPTARGITPGSVLAVADWLDAQARRLANESEGASDGG